MRWGLGVIIGQWRDPATGGDAPAGYRAGFGLLAVLQTAAMVRFLVIARRTGRVGHGLAV